MTKTIKRGIGDLGEDVVCEDLKNKGFSIISRNYLRPWGEIDIVARREEKLHFVEVKTVTRESPFRAEENMHPKKIQRLHRVIQTYLLEQKLNEADWQLDLACVELDIPGKKAKVEVLENIIL